MHFDDAIVCIYQAQGEAAEAVVACAGQAGHGPAQVQSGSIMTRKDIRANGAHGRAEPGAKTGRIHEALRLAILEGALAPGTKLPEDAIGERFGVSRTLVRDALGRLAAEGLAELKPNRGAKVAYPTLEEAREVFDVRRGLERMVAELLAGRLTAQQGAQLEAHVGREERALEKDGPESIRLAGEFHIVLAEMTGNQLLLRLVREVSSRCSLILAIYGRPHSSECAVTEHRDLIAALRRGDRAEAAALMDAHLEAVLSRALIAPKPEGDIRDCWPLTSDWFTRS